MRLHKSKKRDLKRKKVTNERLRLKEKTTEPNLLSGLNAKFEIIKAFSDHIANTIELIKKLSQEAEQSKSSSDEMMYEQRIFLSRAVLEINEFPKDLSYSEQETAFYSIMYGASHHAQHRHEMQILEKCLAQAVREAAKNKVAEEAEHQCQSERLAFEQSWTTIEQLSLGAANQLQAMRTSVQSQLEQRTSYARYLEQVCLARRQEVTEDSQATQQKFEQASLEIQNLNHVIETLKEEDDECAALVASLRQEVSVETDTLDKNIEEIAHQEAIEAFEVQNLNEVKRTLKDKIERIQSAPLVANLWHKVVKAKNPLDKQVKEMRQRKALKDLDKMTRPLNDQNDKRAALVANLKPEVAGAKDALDEEVEGTAPPLAMSHYVRILKEEDAESSGLVRSAAERWKQELIEAKDALDMQVDESIQQMAAKSVEIQNSNELMNFLEKGNVEGTRNTNNDYTTQNVANMNMNSQSPRHSPNSCVQGSILAVLKSTRKDIEMKASEEPRLKRMKSSEAATNSARDDGISVIATTKGKQSSGAQGAGTNNNRSQKDENPVVEQEDLQLKGLSQTKRPTSSNVKPRPAQQQFRANDPPSPEQLVDSTVIDPLVDSLEHQDDNPYAFDD